MKSIDTKTPRVVIAGTGSGSGKTTVSMAICALLNRRGIQASPFKCGPDYIDSGLLAKAAGRACSNLDTFLTSADAVREITAESTADIALIEGVMGYYDGAGFTERASTYETAKALKAPVILTVNCSGLGNSAEAVVHGFKGFRPDSGIAGVIYNNASASSYPYFAEAARREGLVPVGFMPRLKDFALPSRHLGLVTAEESDGFAATVNALADTAEKTIDADALMRIADSAPALEIRDTKHQIRDGKFSGLRIAVARDKAFSFRYEDNIRLLEKLGAKAVYFSPIADAALPENADGLILWGGYPELYARELSQNASMRASVLGAYKGGMPILAECGGFLYMHESLTADDGVTYPMAGAVPGGSHNARRAVDFGYWELTAERENPLLPKGGHINVHEFHYWKSDSPGEDCLLKKPFSNRERRSCRLSQRCFMGFAHIHFYSDPAMAERFLKVCREYKEEKQHGI